MRAAARVFTARAAPATPRANQPTRWLSVGGAAPPSVSGSYEVAGGMSQNTEMKMRGGRSSVSGVVATVFGSYGFLGKYVIFRLGAFGSQCILPYRGDGEILRKLKVGGDVGQIVPVPCSLMEEDDIREAVSRSNVVINLLGANHETKNYSFDDVNSKCVHRIAKVCAEFPDIKRFIHVSGLNASHDSESAWCRSKAKGEEAVRHFHPNSTIIRPAPIYGLQNDQFLERMAREADNLPYVFHAGEGDQLVEPVAGDDVGFAIVSCLASTDTAGQTFELGGPEAYTQKKIAEMVCWGMYRDYHGYGISEKEAGMMDYVFSRLPRKFQLFTKDHYLQMKSDRTVQAKPGIKTFKDLEIEPLRLADEIDQIMSCWRGQRAPSKMKGELGMPGRHPGTKLGQAYKPSDVGGRYHNLRRSVEGRGPEYSKY